MRKSPFQFLDAYTLEEKDAFFGRDKEIEILYDMVFKTPLLLVYGLSGTGKTSLIQCGLAGKFDGPDWYPFIIRRNHDINTSLDEALQMALQGKDKGSLTENVSYITKRYLRPVYLIFDQFEELFIMGSQSEQEAFMENIKTLLAADLTVKVLLVMREEYLGYLYPFERIIPNLLDFRMRVERMGPKSIKTVISSSFNKFQIAFQPPDQADKLMGMMIDNISDDKGLILLPYLQVYLDQIYQNDYERTYHEPYSGIKPLDFTQEEIEEFGKIDDVLERFLETQEENIQKAMVQRFPDFPEDGVKKVLDAFATVEGTKLPVKYVIEGEHYVLQNRDVVRNLAFLQPEILAEVFQALDRSRLLRITEDNIELAHDTLADLIDKKRTDKQRQLLEVRKRLDNSFKEFLDSGQYLNEKQLALFSEFLPMLSLDPKILDFIKKSEEELKHQHEAELARQRRELEVQEERKRAQLLADKAEAEQEKVNAEKQKLRAEQAALKATKRSRRLMILLIAALAIAASLAGYVFYKQATEAKTESEAVRREKVKVEEALAKVEEEKAKVESLNDSIKIISRQRKTLIDDIGQQMQNLDAILLGDSEIDGSRVMSTGNYIKGLLEGKDKATIENEVYHAFIYPENFYTTRGRNGAKRDEFRANDDVWIYAGIRVIDEEEIIFQLVTPAPDPDTLLISRHTVYNNFDRQGYRVTPFIRRNDHQKSGEYTVILRNGPGNIIGKTTFKIR